MHEDCPKVTETITSLNYEKIALNNKSSNLKISENRKQNQEANNTVKSEEAINEKYEELFDCEETPPNINLLTNNVGKTILKSLKYRNTAFKAKKLKMTLILLKKSVAISVKLKRISGRTFFRKLLK